MDLLPDPQSAPDLTVTSTHTGSFTQGQTGATYTVKVTNSGSAATSGTVNLSDLLPAGLTATIDHRCRLDDRHQWKHTDGEAVRRAGEGRQLPDDHRNGQRGQ